jgi:glutathione S-transferase
MKLYYHPVSTTSRSITFLAARDGIDLEYEVVDVFKGAHLRDEFRAINPNAMVPVLEDGDFRLTEGSAILKYLADLAGSSAYPREAKARARVNSLMDWFNTGLSRDLDYGFIYSQLLPNQRHPDELVQKAMLDWYRGRAKTWLQTLDQHMLGPSRAFLHGDMPSLADFMGTSYLTLGEVIRIDYSAFPNIVRWLDSVKALPHWQEVNAPFYAHFVAPFKDTSFAAL